MSTTTQESRVIVEPGRSAQEYLKELLGYMLAEEPAYAEAISWVWVTQARKIGMTMEVAEGYRTLAVAIRRKGLPA